MEPVISDRRRQVCHDLSLHSAAQLSLHRFSCHRSLLCTAETKSTQLKRAVKPKTSPSQGEMQLLKACFSAPQAQMLRAGLLH